MSDERLLARGEYEELKDRASSLRIEFHSAAGEIKRSVSVVDPRFNLKSVKLDVARAMLDRLDAIALELENLDASLAALRDKWGFK